MIHRYAVAIGAGCAAAFLFAVSSQTSPLAMALAYLAPLPIMIATMGWGVGAGAIAAATSVAGLTLLAEPFSSLRYAASTGLLFAASVAAPAWVLAACATAPMERYLPGRSQSGQSYASVGAIVTVAAADRHARRRRGADGGHPDLRRLCRGSEAGRVGARRARERRPRREGQRRGADIRRIARPLRPGRDRGVDPPHAQRQSLRRRALDPTFASAAEAVARSADLPARALAARDHRDWLRARLLCPARSGVAVFLDRPRRARRRVFAAGPRGGARAVTRPQTEDRDAGRSVRLLRAEGQIHPSRPRGARRRGRVRAGCAPAPAFLPSPRPTTHK